MLNFKQKVLNIISAIPQGKVMSYGQVAAAAGSPRAARQVGGILMHTATANNLPWWRVVNNRGEISIKGNWTLTKQLQRELLIKEGVPVSENFTFDIEKYRQK